ncbi:PPOX class F420-dependent oxidoreductase [Natronorubrum sp. FCH18a]|uniref:PPOX class F420-dependent oxidoreductase n=1 Tax=Natronorubrum sp. FCH18a TaxID=3447018 RepID=UPI003F512DB9
MTQIPSDYEDLLTGDAIAHVATVSPDGCPHQAPVWVDYDGEYVYIGGKVHTRKNRNLERDPRISISVTDPENPYRFLTVRGTVVERSETDAMAFIDRLSEQYWGCEFPSDRDADRVKLTIRPDHAVGRTIPQPE